MPPFFLRSGNFFFFFGGVWGKEKGGCCLFAAGEVGLGVGGDGSCLLGAKG